MRNVQTDLVLMQIAAGLQSLVKNPDLSQSIKDYYALSEEEKNRANEARDLITNADKLRAEFKKREDALVHMNELIAKEENIRSANEETLKRINVRQAELDAVARKNADDAEENAAEAKRLESLAVALSARESRIEQDEADIAQTKADLKKRADNISKLAAG